MHDNVLVSGTTFLITDDTGDIKPDGAEGLFVDDTRHLSAWQLLVGGQRLRALSTHRDTTSGEIVLVPPAARGSTPPCAVFRTQVPDEHGLVERLRVLNLRDEARTVELGYRVAADFADQFELRSDRDYDKPGATHEIEASPAELVLRYQRDGYAKSTTVRPGERAGCDGDGVFWRIELAPHAEVALTTTVRANRPERAEAAGAADVETVRAGRRELDRAFLAEFALPPIDHPLLCQAVHKGLDDVASLMIPAPASPGVRLLGAGAPWFLTLFGRDSLISSLAVLPFMPGLAATTLRTLAAHQGTVVRPERCEEPGKIVHEIRNGELSLFGQVPYARYYGTVDATPLFLVLLGAHRMHTGDDSLAEELEPAARAAVTWMERYGGLDEHGYLVYPTDTAGLVHHCWKDSPYSMSFSSGAQASGPIAVSEVQGYAVDALTRTAAMAREVWHDPGYADRLERRAAELADRFVADFWMPEHEFPALALDGDGKQVDLLASNAGHLLWSGLLDDAHAEAVARRLLGPEFFSGWGLRTVAAGQRPYHPVSYHNGGVWPHDTAIAVAGLARNGLTGEAERLAGGLLDLASRFEFRLPEVITGFGVDEVAAPVRYPHSCSPQAWAATAPLLVLGALGGGF